MSTAATAASGCSEIHATGRSMTWRRTSESLTTPKTSSYIHFHICAATTVGIAQGTSMTARITPRPLKPELTTSAMIMPSTSSMETVITVNFTVTTIASRKIVSSIRLR